MKRKTRNIICLILYLLFVISLFLPLFNIEQRKGIYNFNTNLPKVTWSENYNFFHSGQDFFTVIFVILISIVTLLCIYFTSVSLIRDYIPNVSDKYGIFVKWNNKVFVIAPSIEIVFISSLIYCFKDIERHIYFIYADYNSHYSVKVCAIVPIIIMATILIVGEIDIYRRMFEFCSNQSNSLKILVSKVLRIIGILGILIGAFLPIEEGFLAIVTLLAAILYILGRSLAGFPSEEMQISENAKLQMLQPFKDFFKNEPDCSEITPFVQDKTVVLPVTNNSVVDEIRKYSELLKDGIITQEEFDAKKKQLLDL